jgi:DMSO/TMAO reductase YedYZ heme-binding membrane subunit
MTWMIVRGSGLAAFGLLAASTIWGLLLSTGFFGRIVKAKPLTYMHESLAVGAILATLVHLVALSLDDYIRFGWRELFVPGASTYEPLWVSLGIVAFYGIVLVSASFYVRKHIGQQAWRLIHFATFGIFAAGALHGLMAGADSSNRYVQWLYIGTTGAVVALSSMRVMTGGAKPRPKRAVRVAASARPEAETP